MREGPADYPLAALAELRRRGVDEARVELADASGEATGARRRAAEVDGLRIQAGARRREAEGSSPGADAGLGEARERWRARLRREEAELAGELSLRAEEVERAEERVAACRLALVQAERRLRAVERHRELWDAARVRERLRAEELAQDELAAAGCRWGAGAPPQRRT